LTSKWLYSFGVCITLASYCKTKIGNPNIAQKFIDEVLQIEPSLVQSLDFILIRVLILNQRNELAEAIKMISNIYIFSAVEFSHLMKACDIALSAKIYMCFNNS
jgi:hypothetical protein